ncbi:MAG: peptidase [Rubinisphaera brasiliensis]|uniref:peptidase n=1 Tax=Rubinisphaera brasiliensis TaxID=119 RepID=UPI003919ECA9
MTAAPSSDSRHLSRRSLLQSAAVVGVASVAAPFFVHASDKAGSKDKIVGSGEHQYRCHHNWGDLPDGHKYGGATHGTAVDEAGHIYITHYGSPGSVFVFDPDGQFVRSLGEVHVGRGHGIDILKEGSEEFIYLSPSDARLSFAKLTLGGDVVWQRGRNELNQDSGVYDNPKTKYRPTNASFRPDGGYYLGDGYGSFYLFEYDANDKFVRAIGGAGTEAGQFSTPHGQWLDERSGEAQLVVADRANKRLQWFSLDGSHVRTQDGFLFPADIDIRGDVMLVPDLHARITLLNKQNEVLTHLGDDAAWREQALANGFAMRKDPSRWKDGRFVHPHDACFDKDGNIFVAEWVVGGRVTKLERLS